jgi:hypothetical protein
MESGATVRLAKFDRNRWAKLLGDAVIVTPLLDRHPHLPSDTSTFRAFIAFRWSAIWTASYRQLGARNRSSN